MLALFLLLSTALGNGLSSHRIGLSLDAGVGGNIDTARVQPAVAGLAHIGLWTGKYDDAYSLGRYWSAGPTLRVDWRPDALRLAPMLEVRRGVDILLLGGHLFIAGGALSFHPEEGPASPIGWTARTGLGVKLRRHAHWGWIGRFEVGLDQLDGQTAATLALIVGGSFARPLGG